MHHYVRNLDPSIKRGPWTKAEDALLVDLVRTKVDEKGRPQWAEIAKFVEGRTEFAVRKRHRNTLDPKIKRGPWTKDEDALLADLVQTKVDEKGRPQWAEIAKFVEGHTEFAVRSRYRNTLDPKIKRGSWTEAEEALLEDLFQTMVDGGGRPLWQQIGNVIGRSGNAVQIHWTNVVNLEIKRGQWTESEDERLIKLIRTEVDQNGRPRWIEIGRLIGGRVEHDVRNRWLVHLSPKDELD